MNTENEIIYNKAKKEYQDIIEIYEKLYKELIEKCKELKEKCKKSEEKYKKLEEKKCYECINKVINDDLKNKNKSLKKQIKSIQDSQNFYEHKESILKNKIKDKIRKIELEGIWIDEDYYYNEALEDDYPICKEEFTKEEVEDLVINILKRLSEE